MALTRLFAVMASAALLTACGNEGSLDTPAEFASPAAPAPAPPAAPAGPPFMPVATVLELMESTIAHAAEEYWGAVAVIVDDTGVHELYPETDEDWEEVWAAAITIAESGNLLMMAPRAVDDGAWMQYSRALVEVGVEAAAAAQARDPEQVFAAGEKVYNVCTACHMAYIPLQ